LNRPREIAFHFATAKPAPLRCRPFPVAGPAADLVDTFLSSATFLRKKMSSIEKIPTEKQILDWLGNVCRPLPPLAIDAVKIEARPEDRENGVATDAVTEVTWQDRRFRFATELRSLSTPKAIDTAVERAKTAARQLKLFPLIVTPYLSEDQLQRLEKESVSGLDLCGNGIFIVPGELLVYRTGRPNKFPRNTPIRNVFRGSSSIIARSFLLQPEYASAQHLRNAIEDRGSAATLPTISKVCKTLAEELIIERERNGRAIRLRLLQAEKLLDALASNYRSPDVQNRYVGKVNLTDQELTKKLRAWEGTTNEQIVRTGSASTGRYATMAREPVAAFYCTNVSTLVDDLGQDVSETDRFANIEFIETSDTAVYFDGRQDLAASPIQCFLELSTGDKRERETAQQLRKLLLEGIGDK